MTSCCDGCKKENQSIKVCSKCKNAKYCSKECQINDWKTHKPECQNWQEEVLFITSHLSKFKDLHIKMLKKKQPEIGVFRISMDNTIKFNVGFVNSQQLKNIPTFQCSGIDLAKNIVVYVSRTLDKTWNRHIFPC